jgi:carbamoyl-phosphate synthase small subunit
MTYPLIGNYGVNPQDVESRKILLSGFVVGKYVSAYSNYRAKESLADYLKAAQIVGIDGVDTRAITRKLRSKGSMRGVVGSENIGLDTLQKQLLKVPNMTGQNLAAVVAAPKSYEWRTNSDHLVKEASSGHVVVIDCGVKFSILRKLVDEGVRVTVAPPSIRTDEILKLKPDGLLISNGPGDPDAVKGLPEVVASLIGKLPIFGICLGHQILGLAIGAKTYKLKFGHHGANHPVRNERTGRIEITSQNHGFAVDGESLIGAANRRYGQVKVTHVHLSDGTIEGFELPDCNAKAIQYHPEAGPGPHDAVYLFKEFVRCIRPRSIA